MHTWQKLVLGTGLVVAIQGWAGDFRIDSMGARAGFSIAAGTKNDFRQAEGFLGWRLPWRWKLGKGWSMDTHLDVSAGWMGNQIDQGFVATAGPIFGISRQGLPFAFRGGISPTVLSEENFGTINFGIPLQFTSHAGLYWQPGAHCDLGYRFQHMSNAGLSIHNPGLNLHMFSLGYRF